MSKRDQSHLHFGKITEETKKQKLHSQHEDDSSVILVRTHENVRMMMVDFSTTSCRDEINQNGLNHDDDSIRRLELLLKTKFSRQQMGKKKWVLNRELKYKDFFPVEFIHDKEFVLNHIKKYGYGLQYSPSLQGDRNFVLQAVQHNGMEIQFVSDHVRNDKQVVLEAIKQNEYALEFTFSIFCRYGWKFILEVLPYCPEAMGRASTEQRKDREMVKSAMKINGLALRFIHLNIDSKHDQEIVLEAIKQNKDALREATDFFLKDHDFLLKALKLIYPEFESLDSLYYSKKEVMIKLVQDFDFFLQFASNELRNDREFVLHAVRNGNSIFFASEVLRSDKEIALAAVNHNGYALRFISDHLKRDKEIVLAAINQDPLSLSCAPEDVRNDKDVAVRHDGYALQCASEQLKNDKEIVLTAVRQNGFALYHADDVLKNDQEVVFEAIKKDSETLKHASKKLLRDKQFLLEAIKLGCKNVLRFAPRKFEHDKVFLLQAIKHNCLGVFGYDVKRFGNDKEIMLEAVKQNGYALWFAAEELQHDRELVMEALKCNGFVLEYCDELYQERMEHCYYGAYLGTNRD
ncbi:hypothetical protein C9374_001495 [Naegleria lovaniensis]|uniref:DUF4116 domain-containing protein n=1 Tax=Naegleria lovaniensis TaxID=51637 RepID=A0AA88GWM9_NAELO|nr:uncharacterized protein C9374_001495 [Naegleria lovaniensis]KAG2387163.1 hypothetical protein C9374_001495 [Naegleria lovaniensis]